MVVVQRVMTVLFLVAWQLSFLVTLGAVFAVGSRLVPGWLTWPSELDIVSVASWAMLLLALYYLLSDNPFFSAAAALVGLAAGLISFLAADAILHYLQVDCAVQPPPFTASHAYRALGLTSLMALLLNIGVLSTAMRRAAKLVLSKVEGRPGQSL